MFFEGDSGGILGSSRATATPQCVSLDSAAIDESGEGKADTGQISRETSTTVSCLDHLSVDRKEPKRLSREGSPHHDSSEESSGDAHAGGAHRGCDIDDEKGDDGRDTTGNSTHKDADYPLHRHTTSGNDDFGALRKSSFLPPPSSRAFIHLFSRQEDQLATPKNGDCDNVLPIATGNDKYHSEYNSSQMLPYRDDTQCRETTDHISRKEGVGPAQKEVETISSSSRRQPLETLRTKAQGSKTSPSNGGGIRRDDTVRADRCINKVASRGSNHEEITNADRLKALLRREREDRARERAGREVAEREASLALTSLEVKAKR